ADDRAPPTAARRPPPGCTLRRAAQAAAPRLRIRASRSRARLRRPWPSAAQHPQELRLVDDGDAELLRLLELAPGLFAGDDEVGLLRHRAAGLSARLLDARLGVLALERRQRAGDDEGLARDALDLLALLLVRRELHAGR